MSKKVIVALALCALIPGRAWAHATPTIYEPDSGARLEAAPERITIVFSERIEERASSIVVFAADGSHVEQGPARVDPVDAHRFLVELGALAQGSYTVSWQVVSSDDGHFTKGAYAFGIGVAAAAGAERFEVSHSSAVPEAVTLWIELIGQAILLAALVMFAWGEKRRMWRLVIFGAWLVVIGAVAFIGLKTNQLAGVRGASLTDAFMPFMSTNAGMAAAARAGLALVVLFTWQRVRVLAWLAVIGMVFLRSLISHAAASKVMPELSVVINTVHLFFKDLWIGALIIAVEAILPLKDRTQVNIFLKKLARLTIICLLVAGITGVYIVWLHLKGFGNVLGTSWGRMFVILSLFGGMLFAARIAGWYALRMRPALQKYLSLLLVFEMFAGVLALFATAFIIITTPPLGAPEMILHQVESNGATLTLEERLAEPGTLIVEVESEMPVRNTIVTLTNSAYNIGPIVAPIEKRFDGGYAVPKEVITPAGAWRFDVTAQRDGVYDAVASYESNWPLVESGREKILEMMLGAALAGIIMLSGFLWWWTGSMTFDGEFVVSDRDFWRGLGAALLCACVVWVANSTLLKGPFQRSCEAYGDMWHTMQPMRDGEARSQAAFEGCMTADGRNHFTDGRDYEYFKK
ncbi:MAG: copper resistance protein CopC [Patescibacteria group bacterium]